jgi:hypothetical protein
MNTFNLSKQFSQVNSEPDQIDSRSQIVHLIAGLERQKDELGAIAFELLDLLHRLGVGEMPQSQLPQLPQQTNSKT